MKIYPFTILCYVNEDVEHVKHVEQLNFPSPYNIIYPTVTENEFIIWNYSFSG